MNFISRGSDLVREIARNCCPVAKVRHYFLDRPFAVYIASDTCCLWAFSAGDLMMVSVLLRLKASGMLDDYSNLAAYVARGEARPAYKHAFDAQWAINKP